MAGFDAQTFDVERGEFGSYLFGEWSRTGWLYYNIVCFLMKEHLTTILLLLIAPLALWRFRTGALAFLGPLAAIRVEDPQVFRAVHELPFQLARDGIVTGLRIDHVDGLRDPHGYLRQLQRELGSADGEERFYVVVEKILLGDERLPDAWPVAGTTGYDALGLLDRVLTDPEGEAPLRAIWESFARGTPHYDDVAYHSRKLVLQASLSSELSVTSASFCCSRSSSRRRSSFATLSSRVREILSSLSWLVEILAT